MLLVPSATAAATNAKASPLDKRIAHAKEQVKHDRAKLHYYKHRMWRHQAQLKRLQELQRIEALSPIAAIITVFGSAAPSAINVAACESGGGIPANIDIYAKNGQYLGMFQMGDNERATYATIGYSTAYEQTVAAHNYYVDAKGWTPWQCQP